MENEPRQTRPKVNDKYKKTEAYTTYAPALHRRGLLPRSPRRGARRVAGWRRRWRRLGWPDRPPPRPRRGRGRRRLRSRRGRRGRACFGRAQGLCPRERGEGRWKGIYVPVARNRRMKTDTHKTTKQWNAIYIRNAENEKK